MTAAISQNQPTVTFSWDDGHPLDLRTAQLMADHALVGTFYIPISITTSQLDRHQLLELCAMGMEIGSHGLTHRPLTRSNNIQKELVESKDRLEQMIGKPVLAFCYPFGKFNRKAALSVRSSGYSLARTTVAFSITKSFDRFRMPVTIQFAPQSSLIRLRHALKDGNTRGLINWGSRWRFETELAELSRRAFDDACRERGSFHLWGHSWEIDQLRLWSALKEFCQYIGRRPAVRYLTNSCVAAESGQ
jgi:peptidoglycan-N-acetylglucosamine deacetylase